jgi:APA family basic amino acid/polyamine antiporter
LAAQAQPVAAERPLGFWMAVALVVGNMIGSGVFLLPTSLGPHGINSVAGWAFTATGAVLLALVFATLSRSVPGEGGPYVYTRAAFGEWAGFLVAWSYWIAVWSGNAAIATGTVSYLSALVPAIGEVPGAAPTVTVLAVWVFTLVNCWGVRAAGWVQAVTTVLKLLPLLAVMVLGLLYVRGDALAAVTAVPLTLGGTTAAATLTLWAMIGLESATIPADKVQDASRTIPRATVIGTLVTALVCAASCSVVLLLVPPERLATSPAPFADAARAFWGERSATLIAVFATISGFGALNGWILLQGDLPCSLARDGVFPRFFARMSSRDTPVLSHVATSALVSVLVLMNYQRTMADAFQFVLLLSTSATLIAYLSCALGLLVLRGRGVVATGGGMAAVAALAAGYSLWAIVGAGKEALGWGLVLLLAGVPVRAMFATGSSGSRG